MDQPKNVQFTNLIKAGGRLREFNFRKSQGVRDPMFTIDVATESGDRFYLFYRLKNNTWTLENKKVVSWIEEVLPQIEETINSFK